MPCFPAFRTRTRQMEEIMTKRQSSSRRRLPNSSEPPPIPYMPSQHQVDGATPNDPFFTDGLIRFLIVNFSLLAVLLAVNIFVVLSAQSVQLSQESGETISSDFENNDTLVSSNAEEKDGGKPNPNKFRPPTENISPPEAAGHEVDSRLANTVEVPAAFVSTVQPVDIVDQPQQSFDARGKRTNEGGAVEGESTENESVKNAEESLVNESTPQSSFLHTGQLDDSIRRSPTCENPSSNESGDSTIVQVRAPFYGTKIEWHRRVDDASRRARSEDKLIFLMHVSGNFTKEDFT